MLPPLKLSSIDQEHLQELYDGAGVPRDELPYTPEFEQIVQGFQDRTFKNAQPEQVFGALLKYSRSGSHASSVEPPAVPLTDDQLKQLRAVLSRHLTGGKILPYSDEFVIAKGEFQKVATVEISDQDFWRGVQRSLGPKRRPPAPRKKVAKAAKDDSDDDGE